MPEERTNVPLISVIVPVYNVGTYLDECINSIRNQTFRDLQIICVNDGSTDDSLERLRKHAAQDSRIEIIDKKNAGYGHTINCGLDVAAGDYISIVESDDFIEPNMIETMLDIAREHQVDIVRVNYWLYWSEPEPKDSLFESYFSDVCGSVINPRELTSCFFFPPALWSMLVRRDIITDHNLRLLETPGASYQDTSFSFKLWACAERAWLIHEPFLHYRQDNESSSINAKDKAHYVCMEYQEIERFIQEDLKEPELMPLAIKRKFDAYAWNLARIAEHLRPEFAEQAASEFKQAQTEGHLDKNLFTPDEWMKVSSLIEDPMAFTEKNFNDTTPPKPSLQRMARRFARS